MQLSIGHIGLGVEAQVVGPIVGAVVGCSGHPWVHVEDPDAVGVVCVDVDRTVDGLVFLRHAILRPAAHTHVEVVCKLNHCVRCCRAW